MSDPKALSIGLVGYGEVGKIAAASRAGEREVRAGRGVRTREIAVALGISPQTVETDRSRLMRELGIDTVSGLVRFAVRVGHVLPYARHPFGFAHVRQFLTQTA